ncbi:MAG: DNA polymerase I [bacterium]
MEKNILLIDGHSILNRAFYGLPSLTNSEGLNTNAIYGFINILIKILDEEQSSYVAVAFDVSQPTFRHEMYKEYKGTRKGMPDELREQVPIMKEILTAMGIKIYEIPGFEADDVIGTIASICEEKRFKTSILSGDRDLLQLATDSIKIKIPKTKKGTTTIENYYKEDVIKKYEVSPTEFIDVKALMGDPSDNIPGVPGIGEKTAIKIIKEYKTIENAYKNVDVLKPNRASTNLKEFYDQAVLSKELATIKTQCKIDFNLEETKISDLFNEDSYKYFKHLEFKSLLNRFDFNVNYNDISSINQDKFIKISNINSLNNLIKEMEKTEKLCLQLIGEEEFKGVSLSFNEEKIYYIPLSDSIQKKDMLCFVKNLINNNYNQTIIMHHLKKQLNLVSELIPDLEPNISFDTHLAAYLCNPLKDTYDYDDLANDYLDIVVPSKEDIFGKGRNKKSINSIDDDILTSFACYQVVIPFLAYDVLVEKLEDNKMIDLFYNIEMPLITVLYEMEKNGIKVDNKALNEYGKQLRGRIEELENNIFKSAGEKFNINSPKQLGVILFERLSLPVIKKTKTGYSTAQAVLEKLINKHPIINYIMEYRQLVKLKTTYADGLNDYINSSDSRIHGKFNQTITATGRISSTEPNLQNIPIRLELGRAIRKVFIPEEEYCFVDADYSQIELRLLADLSQDEKLIEAYRNNKDIHRLTASQVFHVPFDEVTSLQRSNAKAVNFGIVYGMGAFSLGQDLNITRKEAETYINNYFKKYPGVKFFLDNSKRLAKERGYAITMFGRRRPIPELKSKNFMQRSFGERVAMNSPIQGGAADIIKIAMIKVYNKLKELNMKSKLILQVHDELLIETHKDEIEKVKDILYSEMQNAVQLSVPLEIDVHVGNNWYETK